MSVEEIASSGIVPSQREMIDGRLSEWSLIYEGAYSLLYKAKRYGKWHIVKCLRAEFRGNELYESLLMKEFEVGVMLEHKNIGKTESYENDERFGNLIVKEYVDGVTLPNFLKGNVSKAERRRILDEILSAMSYWHSFQIVHRDLKPENVMITRNGSHVKVIDFGLSDTDSHAILKQPAGTEKYMSPEQKSGELAIDCRSDIYSFGMLLKDLFPSCYSNVCRKCTEQDREKRYGSANEIQRALDKTDKMKKFLLVLVPVLALVLIAVIFAGKNGIWSQVKWLEYSSEDLVVDTLTKAKKREDAINNGIEDPSERKEQESVVVVKRFCDTTDTSDITKRQSVIDGKLTEEEKNEIEQYEALKRESLNRIWERVKAGEFKWQQEAADELACCAYNLAIEGHNRMRRIEKHTLLYYAYAESVDIWIGKEYLFVSQEINKLPFYIDYKNKDDKVREEYDKKDKMYRKEIAELYKLWIETKPD